MRRGGITHPPMPPNPAPHITEWLVEMGLSEAAGMGVAPLSWTTIDAWCRRTGIDLSPWEARLIRRLSQDYIAMSRKAECETCPPPWRAPTSPEAAETELTRLRLVLG
jgi:hypothetical protein